MPVPERDWRAVLQRVIEGDRLAVLQVARLVNGLLARWNAYDFRDEWEDLVQEVIATAAIALRDGRIRDPQALAAYLKTTARFKYLDLLRVELDMPRGERLPWEEVVASRERWREQGLGLEAREDLRRALARVPDKKREVLMAVHLEGLTYEEAARATGIPLGTLKRYLRDGLAQLRDELSDLLERG